MTRTVVLGEPPPAPLADWLARRRELGQDLFDEVWDGEYHVVPAAHRRHGDLDDQLACLLRVPARRSELWPSGPANIGQPQDFRVPDRVYFARRDPQDFEPTAVIVVEIVFPGDESYAKFGFYFDHDVQELLIVDPQRHAVEWYTRGAEGFERAERGDILGITEDDLRADIDWPG